MEKVRLQLKLRYDFRIFTEINNAWITCQNEVGYARETYRGCQKWHMHSQKFIEIRLTNRIHEH